MELRINRYHAKNNTLGFDSYGTSAWVSASDWKELFGEEEAPLFAELRCKVPSPFKMYAKINILNPASELGTKNGLLTLPYEIVHRSFLIGINSTFEISKADISKCSLAESVTIQLPKGNNTYLSTLEVARVEENLRQQHKVLFEKQCIFLFPETKDPILCEITNIVSNSGGNSNILLQVTPETKFIYTNLRTDAEQVLDLNHIGGLDETLKKLRKIIQIPMNHPEYYARFGIERPKGLLLYGPPGNGKTTIAKALAKSLGGAAFIEVKMTEIWASHVGDGERRLEEYFKEAEKVGNCIIFLDEIDAIAKKRRPDSPGYEITLVGTLLSLMDGLNSNSKVFVIGATNRRDSIDPAFRRPGRFDLEEEIPLPNSVEAREDILSKIIPLEKRELFDESVSRNYLHHISESTIGYSGADLRQLYREAALSAISSSIDFDQDGKEIILKDIEHTCISPADFEKAQETTTPTQLRGLENPNRNVLWDDIIALDAIKLKMSELHRKMCFFSRQKELLKRPSFCSIVLTGESGTGKHTFLDAFSKQYGYEKITINFLELESQSDITQAYQYVSDMFLKCRQIGKALLILENLDKISRPEKYMPIVFNENEKISKTLSIFTILVCESKQLIDQVIGYKRFGIHFDFDIEDSIVEKSVMAKFGLKEKIWTCKNHVGEIITYLQEHKFERAYNS